MLLEYILTYGWILLVLLVIVGIFVYLGILIAMVFMVGFDKIPPFWILWVIFIGVCVRLLIQVIHTFISIKARKKISSKKKKSEMKLWLLSQTPLEFLATIAKILFFGYFLFVEPIEYSIRISGIIILAVIVVIKILRNFLSAKLKIKEPFKQLKLEEFSKKKKNKL